MHEYAKSILSRCEEYVFPATIPAVLPPEKIYSRCHIPLFETESCVPAGLPSPRSIKCWVTYSVEILAYVACIGKMKLRLQLNLITDRYKFSDDNLSLCDRGNTEFYREIVHISYLSHIIFLFGINHLKFISFFAVHHEMMHINGRS